MDNQQEGSLQTLHIGGSGYRRRSHLVHEQADEKDLQREIDDLKRDFVEHNENKPLRFSTIYDNEGRGVYEGIC